VIRTVAIKTLGCRLNQAESETIRFDLEQRGLQVVQANMPADLVVINSCAVTQAAEAKMRGAIAAVRRTAPDALIAVVGCAAYLGAERLRQMPAVKLILGNSEKNNLPQYLPRVEAGETIVALDDLEESPAVFKPTDKKLHPERIRVLLKVQDGCDYHCSYCVVPHLRGEPRSRPLTECISEVKQLVAHGCQEVVLTGINLGLYQTAEGDLTTLVERILTETDLPRLRLSSIEPDLVTPQLITLMRSNNRLCQHWHIPLQYGTDAILRQMRRRYTTAFYSDLVQRIKDNLPAACVGADVMVGYPGETTEAFEEMRGFLQKLALDYLHVFRYSPRPYTSSIQNRESITSAEKKRRSQILINLSAQKRRHFRSQFIGQILTILFEEQVGPMEWQGLSGNYLTVRVFHKDNLLNKIFQVRIIGESGNVLKGEIVSE